MNRLLRQASEALALLSRHPEGVESQVLTQALAMSRSAGARLVAEMVDLGWVDRCGTRLHLGPRAEFMVRRCPYRPDLMAAADAPLRQAVQEIAGEGQLGIMRDTGVLVLVEHSQIGRIPTKQFVEQPDPYLGALGHILLSTLDWRQRRRIWDVHGPPQPVRWQRVLTWTDFCQACADMRRRGVEVNCPTIGPLAGVAAAIADGQGGWVALSLRVPKRAWHEEQMLSILRRLVDEVSRRLASA